jgi:peptide/nickel transport system ATP-binding protein
MADQIGVLYLGRLAEVNGATQLFDAPRHPYTRMLLDAVPDIEMTGRRRKKVEGEIPSPLSPPPGCAFHPRCPFANDRCRSEVPVAYDGVACHAVHEGRISAGPPVVPEIRIDAPAPG